MNKKKLFQIMVFINGFMYGLAPTVVLLLSGIKIIKMSCIDWDVKLFPIVCLLCFSVWMINKYWENNFKDGSTTT